MPDFAFIPVGLIVLGLITIGPVLVAFGFVLFGKRTRTTDDLSNAFPVVTSPDANDPAARADPPGPPGRR